ncbi:LuxR family transcriptional regulator [Streptomyces sp. NBC_00102]|uniref:helix-turn-helix transcriptional regulator n=1 Tax=Streptomyces sp. NBC_00102 TaxID=2975652 RepID=UPI0022580216|nr:LuxR family transcriptional regulator [Streptomyces sp. NBC_00102]MCX5402294.1 LuxR C-terminal-related transcriptional regulator [Streptomyces sp. NBC_00102]
MSVAGSGSDASGNDEREVFVGRRSESERLAACADKVRGGEAWLAVVEGEAGIGKSALIRRAVSSLEDFTVLWAVGDPSETDLPGGVLSQLVRRVDRDLTARFPLLARPGAAGVSPHALGGQLLLLLGALQESGGGVAVVVDDAHWADPLSSQVLGFVVRRLWADRVLVLMATRTDSEQSMEALARLVRSVDRAVRVEVGGLGQEEVDQLARRLLAVRVTPELVTRLHGYTKGHPLYVRTVLAEVPLQVLGDESARRWPVHQSLRAGIGAALGRLPADSVALVEALAVLDGRFPLVGVARVAGVADAVGALEPALAAGLVKWWPTDSVGPVALVHGLQRDAVYAGIGPGRRRALHTAAAEVVGSGAAWAHRVAAADSDDPVLAADLERSANTEALAGRNALAATRLLWASSLSDDPLERERRLLTACAQWLLTLQPWAAVRLRAEVEECAEGTLRSCVLGVMDLLEGRLVVAEARLTEAWQEALADPDASWVALLAGTFLTVITIRQCRGARTADIAGKTLAIGDLDAGTSDFIRAVLATGRMWDQGPGAALLDVAHLPVEAAEASNDQLATLATRGVMHLFLGRLAAARADLLTVAHRDRLGAASKLSHLSSSLLAVVEYLGGDWSASESAADRALAIAAAHDHVLGDAATWFAAVCVQAGRGHWEAAEESVEALERINRMLGDPPAELVYAGLAGAVLAQARGDHAAMLRSLAPLVEPVTGGDEAGDEAGDGEDRVLLRFKPLWLWQQSLLVEALTGTGRLVAAASALDDFWRGYDGSGYLRVVGARLSGRLAEAQGRPREALAIYAQALGGKTDGTGAPDVAGTGGAEDAGEDAPLFRAMLEHAYGRLLVATRTGSRRDAARWFKSAHDRFDALRAEPFLRRCETDLAAMGLTAPAHARQQVLALTEREVSVAHLIAGGKTNQEAATELYVTQKTVEYHLSNIYAKLGITSRRHLAQALRTPRT